MHSLPAAIMPDWQPALIPVAEIAKLGPACVRRGCACEC
jgi:hypothetical protein